MATRKISERAATGGRILALPYVRVSGNKQAKFGMSLADQEERLREYARQNGWQVHEVYVDPARSRQLDRRPRYREMLAEVRRLREQGDRPIVCVTRLDRFGGKQLTIYQAQAEFEQLGVELWSIADGGLVKDDVTADVKILVARQESRLAQARTLDAKRRILESRHFPGGRPVWGYTTRPATAEERLSGAPKAVLTLDERQAPYARECFRRSADGESPRKLSVWIDGLPSEVTGGRAMNPAGVRKFLRCPTVVSRQSTGDPDVLARPLCHWPALVDDELYARAQPTDESDRDRTPARAFLLSGYVRCPKCGRAMVGRNANNGEGCYPQYVCSPTQADESGKFCGATVQLGQVERLFLDELRPLWTWLDFLAADEGTQHRAISERWAELCRPELPDQAELEELSAEVSRLEKALASLTVRLALSEVGPEAYALASRQLETDLRAKREARDRLDRQASRTKPPTFAQALDLLREGRSAFDGSEGSAELVAHQRTVLRELVRAIRVERVGYGRYAVSVEWTTVGQALADTAAFARELAEPGKPVTVRWEGSHVWGEGIVRTEGRGLSEEEVKAELGKIRGRAS